MDRVKKLRGVQFKFDIDRFPEMHFKGGVQIGFLAQEVESVFPEVVQTNNVPASARGQNTPHSLKEFKSVAYSRIVPLLVEAFKEQDSRLEDFDEKHTQG